MSALSKETTIICEYESRTIGCPDDQVLEIVNCNYGRTSLRPCAWGNHHVTNCTLPSAVDAARAHCNGRNTCELTAKSGVWKANPCVGVIKYVEVKYICNEVGPSGKNCTIFFLTPFLFCINCFTAVNTPLIDQFNKLLHFQKILCTFYYWLYLWKIIFTNIMDSFFIWSIQSLKNDKKFAQLMFSKIQQFPLLLSSLFLQPRKAQFILVTRILIHWWFLEQLHITYIIIRLPTEAGKIEVLLILTIPWAVLYCIVQIVLWFSQIINAKGWFSRYFWQ